MVAAAPALRVRARESDRIRIAYLSPDFRDHPLAFLTAGMFEQHEQNLEGLLLQANLLVAFAKLSRPEVAFKGSNLHPNWSCILHGTAPADSGTAIVIAANRANVVTQAIFFVCIISSFLN